MSLADMFTSHNTTQHKKSDEISSTENTDFCYDEIHQARLRAFDDEPMRSLVCVSNNSSS